MSLCLGKDTDNYRIKIFFKSEEQKKSQNSAKIWEVCKEIHFKNNSIITSSKRINYAWLSVFHNALQE